MLAKIQKIKTNQRNLQFT